MADLKLEPRVKAPSRDTSDSSNMKLWRGDRTGVAFTADYWVNLLKQGRLFHASDADENDALTAVATFAATTPALLLDVPAGTTCIPRYVNLRQNVGGTEASAPITVTISVETAKVRYASGGTAETNIISARTDKPLSQACTVYSAPTAAAAGTACAIWHEIVTAENAPVKTEMGYKFDWDFRKTGPMALVGPASFLVFAYGTNSPTFQWAIGWAEIPSSDLS